MLPRHHELGTGRSFSVIEVLAHANEMNHIRQKCGGRIVKRKRPVNLASKKTCTVFLDECGNHYLEAPDTFRAFVLSAIIVWDDKASHGCRVEAI